MTEDVVTNRRFDGSPASAYRADMRNRTRPFGPDDDRWLAAAVELRASLGGSAANDHLLDALAIAIDVLGDERIDDFVRREWRGQHCHIEALVVLADAIENLGAFHLAATVLDDLLRARTDITALERGRILSLRARVERKLGRLNDAKDRYELIASLGDSDRTGELTARAAIGLMALAQERGNMPEVRAYALRAIGRAQADNLSQLERLAHQGIAMAESKAGNVDAAAAAAWQAFTLARDDSLAEAEGLQILGQILLEAGQASLARSCFAAVMTRAAPDRIILPALGGLALASARDAREPTTEWAVREVWRAAKETVPSYQLAEALLESATALRMLGRGIDADRYAATAHGIAETAGFHELVYRLDTAPPSPAPKFAEAPAIQDTKLASALAALEPERLPSRLRFESASV